MKEKRMKIPLSAAPRSSGRALTDGLDIPDKFLDRESGRSNQAA
jgi:hypothetical protein